MTKIMKGLVRQGMLQVDDPIFFITYEFFTQSLITE